MLIYIEIVYQRDKFMIVILHVLVFLCIPLEIESKVKG